MVKLYQINIDFIKKNIKQFVIENFLFGSNEILFSDDDSFLENGIIDSTGVLELIEYIEENYHLKCEDEELTPENLDSLNNITSYIIKKTGKKDMFIRREAIK